MATEQVQKQGKRSDIEEANQEALERVNKGGAMLVDFAVAKEVIPGMKDNLILHAGPPIEYKDMIEPMKAAVQGALVFEGRAKTLEEADEIAKKEIEYKPCHEMHTVGPMAGVTTPGMYVCVVENPEFGNKTFCNLNEGRGKILRFGATGDDVIKRLHWMNDVLGPVFKKAVKKKPVDLKVITSQGLQMGDEFHQRFQASSLLWLAQVLDDLMDIEQGQEVIDFVKDREQFFLNFSMPAMKAIMDPADGIEGSTMVVRMTRNGVDFGIQVSGLKDQWFTGPVDIPKGLYFPGYSESDASHDFGDSAIEETGGLGNFASAASPAVTRFIGGTAKDAIRFTEDGYKITVGESRDFLIPVLNFRGCPTGVDIVKVNQEGIVPKLNTGIAGKKAGIGQIGGGISKAPIEAFQDALRAYAKDYDLT